MRRVFCRPPILLGYTAVFFLLLCALLPYVHDDWIWATAPEANPFWGNGRWTSNSLELLMVHSSLAKTFIMALTEWLIVLTPVCLACHSRRTVLMVSFMLFLLMPANIASQTLGWCAGFSTYGISTAAVCLFVLLVFSCKVRASFSTRTYSAWRGIALFVVCLFGSMCAEAVTVLLACLSCGFLAVSLYQRSQRSNVWVALAACVGCAIGTFVLFKQLAYHTSDSYFLFYGKTSDGLFSFFGSCWESFTRLNIPILLEAVPLLVAITGIHLFVAYRQTTQTCRELRFFTFSLTLSCAYLGLRYIGTSWQPLLGYTRHLDAVCLLVWLVSLGVSIGQLNIQKSIRQRCWMLLLCACIPAAALSAVWPNNPRSYLTSYCMLSAVAALESSALPVEGSQSKRIYRLLPFALLLSFFWLSIMGYNAWANQRRVDFVRQRVTAGDSVVGLRELPYADYICYGGRLMGEGYDEAFLDFYKIPKTAQLQNISYAEPYPF